MNFDDSKEINEYIRVVEILKENLKEDDVEDAIDATIKAIEK